MRYCKHFERMHLVAVELEGTTTAASTADCCLSLWTYRCSKSDSSLDMSDSLATVVDSKAGLRS
jgi:hypothetical protein